MAIYVDPNVLLAISDDDRSESGDVAVKSDIAPKRGRGRKSYKEAEVLDDDEDMPDIKDTNGVAAEDDEEEDEDDDLEEDEYDLEPPCLFVPPN